MHAAHTRSVLLLVATALCWSLGGLLIKSVDWPPLAVAGGRGFIALAATLESVTGPDGKAMIPVAGMVIVCRSRMVMVILGKSRRGYRPESLLK